MFENFGALPSEMLSEARGGPRLQVIIPELWTLLFTVATAYLLT